MTAATAHHASVPSGNRGDDLFNRESARRDLALVVAETAALPRGEAVTRIWGACYQDRPRSWVNRHLAEIARSVTVEDLQNVLTYADPTGDTAVHVLGCTAPTCARCGRAPMKSDGPGTRTAKHSSEAA